MKVKLSQLKQLVKEELDAVSQAPKRRKGGGRAALGFAIPEDSPDYGKAAPAPARPSSNGKLGHISKVSSIDARAFRAYVDMLVEDCDVDFYAMGDGRLKAVDPDGTVMVWDPEYSMNQWERE